MRAQLLLGVVAASAQELFLSSRTVEPVATAAPALPLWPVPSDFTLGNSTLTVVPSKDFFTGPDSKLLQEAYGRYQSLSFPHRLESATKSGSVTGLKVVVDSVDESHPQVDADESYNLEVTDAGEATLNAKTVWGALRGLETFSQLVQFDFDSASYSIPQAPWSIKDSPRFPHRGLMIDTSRHFLTLEAIRSIIDSLTYAKLNVLHWHMSDSESFPMESKKRPDLWKSALSPQERYLQSDIADIVEYARMRGVRVMVEFDMPGHAASWCAGYPEVCPGTPGCSQPLNVASNKTFELIEDLLMEMTGGQPSKPGQPAPGLFKDNFIHLGGDEVDTSCWTSTPDIAQWLKDRNMTADQGYGYFVKRAASIAIGQGHRPVQWSDVWENFKTELAKETVVHIWQAGTNVTEVVASGYEVIVNYSNDDKPWYLDKLDITWDQMYSRELCEDVPDDLCQLILGGHGEMWGETVDMSDLEQTVWPKLAAIAERLWSPRKYTSTDDALPRIEAFRCLLNRRGIRAAPVTNDNARSAPSGPGSCYDQ